MASTAAAYLKEHDVEQICSAAIAKLVQDRPKDAVQALGRLILEQSAANKLSPKQKEWKPPPVQDQQAAETIAAYLKCMSTKLKRSGRGEQNGEMMLVHKDDTGLVFEDHGGWAIRNPSMMTMVKEIDQLGLLPESFPPIVLQTGDRCIARRVGVSDVELHLWQRQPLSAELQKRLPLRRVLSMCSTPKYADIAVPDWCFDAWPEAGVMQGGYDAACARLAEAGARPPTDGKVLSWNGTAHHHPSRMRLVDLAKAHPQRLACNNVVDRIKEATQKSDSVPGNGAVKEAPPSAPDPPQHRSLLEQVSRSAYLLDVQGKGYSSRLKLLLHSGRVVFIAARPWKEFYMSMLTAWVQYVPVQENLSDLIDRLDWADTHPDECATIASNAQDFAQKHLTKDAALHALAQAIREAPTT